VAQLYETRTVLECYAVRKAAEQRPAKAAVAAVRAIVARQREALTSTAPARQPMDADFHREITALAGNPVIAELVERTVRQIEAVQARSAAVVRGESARTCRAHASIVAAVAKGDADRAESVMREHLAIAQRAVMAALAAQSAGSG
jgi:DNA-binding GntR family transcriptional regulator